MSLTLRFNPTDAIEHLRPHMVSMSAPAFTGRWATLELQPDLFSPQRFVVGVVLVDADSSIRFRLLEDLSAFECVYGRSEAAAIRSLIGAAEKGLLRAVASGVRDASGVAFECDNVSISVEMPTSGQSPEAVLARLYNDVVVMEPQPERAHTPFVSLDSLQVRRLVADELKRIAGIDHERIFVKGDEQLVKDAQGGVHRLDVSLRTRGGAGNIVSAVYKTPTTIELNLLRASRDLAAYGALRRLNSLALFVMSASPEQFSPSEYDKVVELLDDQCWRLERQGFRVETFDSPRRIAEGIVQWAEL